MFCSDDSMLDPRDNLEYNLCRCRKDMQFDTKYSLIRNIYFTSSSFRNMECRIFLDVDCTYAEKEDIEKMRPEGDKLTEILNILQQDRVVTGAPVGGESGSQAGYDKKMVDKAFCNLIERCALR